MRPYYSPGSLSSGSTLEENNVRRWGEEHAHHPYAKTRDELARAMQAAEGGLASAGFGRTSGDAIFQMAKEIMGAE
jgi:hypothetical protein